MMFSDTIDPNTLGYWVGDGSTEYSQGLSINCTAFRGLICLYIPRNQRIQLASSLRAAAEAITHQLDMEGAV